MLARYYGPGLGRFLSVDPGFDVQTENPQSWNLYAYVRNSPVNGVDPDGMSIYGFGDCSRGMKASYVVFLPESADLMANFKETQSRSGTVQRTLEPGTAAVPDDVAGKSPKACVIVLTESDASAESWDFVRASGASWVFAGHSYGQFDDSGFHADAIKLSDGAASGDQLSGVVGIFSCDSKTIAPAGAAALNSGPDGESSLPAEGRIAAAFTRTLASGGTTAAAVAAGNQQWAVPRSTKRVELDKGDQVVGGD